MLNVMILPAVIVAQPLLDWTQFGPDLRGVTPNDQFGTSLAMSDDGTFLAVGSNERESETIFNGVVRIYQKDPSDQAYKQFGSDITSPEPNNLFGKSLAMSGDGKTLAVGASFGTVDGFPSGQVSVYQIDKSNQSYKQVGDYINAEFPYDGFGWSMAISGDGTILAIGAPFNNGSSGTRSGHVRVYQKNASTQSYNQIGLDIDGNEPDSAFGYSLAMSYDGTTIAVASNGSFYSGNTIRVFQKSLSSQEYRQIGSDIDSAEFVQPELVMSNDGGTIAISSYAYDGQFDEVCDKCGGFRVYEKDSSAQTYNQVSDIVIYSPEPSLVSSLAMSGDGTRILAGALYAVSYGSVRVFQKNETSQQVYMQLGSTIIPTASLESRESFGRSVVMSNDGATIAVGAPSYNDMYPSTVRVYTYPTTTTTASSCGLLGRSLFCPFTFRGVLGRWILRWLGLSD